MKILLLSIAFILSFGCPAQKKEAYYDYFWQPSSPENARYYSTTEKTDSGWLRNDYYVKTGSLQMRALYEDEACKVQNGHCYYFHANGIASTVGKRVHGEKEGIFISYHSNGMMSDSAKYHKGVIVDRRLKWHRNGFMSDSITRLNDSTYVHISWFDDGQVAQAGFILNGKPDGKWKYYHNNGQLAASEIYTKGNRISIEYFDEEGKPLLDTSAVNREAEFKGGNKAWLKYLEKNLFWPTGLQFNTPADVTVGIDFIIDENGKVIDAEVSMPFHKEFDDIALKIIKNSPSWVPGIVRNRKVKAYRRQPVTFTQE